MFVFRPFPSRLAAATLAIALSLSGCVGATRTAEPDLAIAPAPTYQIGAGDNLKIFVWRNDDLSADVPVRPDGRISMPLVPDMPAAGKSPTQLAADIEEQLRSYVHDPVVTVIVTGFTGTYSQQVRIIGQVAAPKAIAYRDDMSLLDAIIAVGGLTQLAAGNRAAIIRKVDGKDVRIPVQLADLLEDGDLSGNRRLYPGDVVIVPESWF